jgi:hypothetical protein
VPSFRDAFSQESGTGVSRQLPDCSSIAKCNSKLHHERRLQALDRLFDGHYAYYPDEKSSGLFVQTAWLSIEPGGFSFGGKMKMMTMLLALALAIVPSSQSGLSQSKKATGQVAFEGSFDLATSADKALLLFTPEGERNWVKDWNPKPVYPSEPGVAFQTNAVFRVDQGGERSLWTILNADWQGHIAEYVYLVEGERLSRVRVEIEPLDVKQCRVRVRYVHTATSEKGLQFVVSVTEETFAQKMRDWHRMVSAAISAHE